MGLPRAVFVGDSITAGTPSGLFGQYRQPVCTALSWRQVGGDGAGATGGLPLMGGIGGTTLQAIKTIRYGFAETVQLRCLAFEPDKVVIFLGANDFRWSTPFAGNAQQTTPDTWRAAWQTVYAALAASPRRPQIVAVGLSLQTKPLDSGPPAWASSDADVADQMDAITCEEAHRAGGTFVLLRDQMTPAMIGPDGIHPLPDAGQTFIAQRIIAALGG